MTNRSYSPLTDDDSVTEGSFYSEKKGIDNP